MNRYRWIIVTPIKKIVLCTPENSHGFSLGNDHCDIRVLIPEPVMVIGNTLKCGEQMLICSPDGPAREARIYPRRVLRVIASDESVEYMRISMEKIVDSDDAWDRTILLTDGTYTFGTRQDLSVVYPAVGDVLSRDFSIICTDNKLVLRADDVMFGVYVNQRRVKPGQMVELKEGDFVFSSSASVYCNSVSLITSAQTQVNGLDYRDSAEGNSHLIYPRMQRTARTHIAVPDEHIEILDPPSVPDENKKNIFTVILPSLIMVFLIALIRGSGTMSVSSMILFSVATMSVGILTSIITYVNETNAEKDKNKKREKNYRRYISVMTETISKRRLVEREKLNLIYIDPNKEIEQVKDFSASLFDRVQSDADFLDVRLGSGRIRSGEVLESRKHESFASMDELFYEPQRLKDMFEYSDELPVVLHARGANAVGFLGGLSSICAMLHLVTLDIAVRQFGEDIKLYYLMNDDLTCQLHAIRLLPQVQDETDGSRNIALASEGYNSILEKLCRLLSERERLDGKLDDKPWLVINIYADESVMEHPLMKYIPVASKLKVVFFFWANERENIPLGCTYEVRLFTNGNKGILRCLEAEAEDQLFGYTPVGIDDMAMVSQRLAPVYSGEIGLGAGLRSNCSFYEALGITEAKSDVILTNWNNNNSSHTLSVPFGVTTGDEPICLDLHETADGPHGLLAGTTGSGKSEVILSYLLSLIYNYSPENVNIVIIDFKGGGLGLQLQGVPHLTGLITNLEKYEIDRSLMSIKAELERRQRTLAAAGVSNISDYAERRRNDASLIALPHLMLVVDEFAELKAQQPDFMNELISAARIGRSLGVHLILSTQKPTGVVNDQISSNTDFVICLRVQTKADSNEMLSSPLAAEIRQPGRGYLKVARKGLFTLFQSGYSGASANLAPVTEMSLNRVTLTGRRESVYEARKPVESDNTANIKQFDAVKDAIIAAFRASGKALPLPLCLPTLGKAIPQSNALSKDGYCVPVALADDPANQNQFVYSPDITNGNILIIGGPQSGKTTFLQTMLFAAAAVYTARDINVYIMDFNSGIFKTFERLDVLGGVAQLDDEEGVRNLIRMLRNEIVSRKNRFVETEVISFAKYRGAGHEDLPAILMMIDNFAVFKEVYDEKYGEDIQYILREGPAVGLCTVVTAAQTAALGYRRLCFFKERIAMYSSDKSEYTSVLEGGHNLILPEVPGRFFFRQNNTILMAQAFMYYADQPEIERANLIRTYVCEHQQSLKARRIPTIPSVLTSKYMEEIRGEHKDLSYAYAMDFGLVEPVTMNLELQFEFAMISAGEDRTLSFVSGLFETAKELPEGCDMYIIDNFAKKLSKLEGTKYYSVDAGDVLTLVSQVCDLANKRMDLVRKGGLEAIENEPLEIVVINSIDAINVLSEDSTTWDAFKAVEERMNAMRVLFIFSDLINRQVSYNSPEVLKHIRDVRKAVIFENTANIKFFELNLAESKAAPRPLGKFDAINFGPRGLSRVRMVK